MAAHEQTYLNAYAEHFQTLPEDPVELLTAFNELAYNVTGYGGLWRKTVPQEYFGCADNQDTPVCQDYIRFQSEFERWDRLQDDIGGIDTEDKARDYLQAHADELLEHIRQYVPADQSYAAVRATPTYVRFVKFAKKAEERRRFDARYEANLKRIQEEEVRKKAEEEAYRHRLGNGYRDAKWGDALAKVKEVLGGGISGEGTESLTLEFEGGTEAVCFFEEGGLSAVEFNPDLKDRDSDGFDAIRDVLVEKYGDYEVVKNMTIQTHDMWGNPNPARPARMMRWEDDDTKLSLYVLKYEGRWAYSTTTVKYESKEAIKAAQEREQEQEEERKRKAAEEARKKVEGVL